MFLLVILSFGCKSGIAQYLREECQKSQDQESIPEANRIMFRQYSLKPERKISKPWLRSWEFRSP